MFRKAFYMVLFCAIAFGVSAQDVHYSQYFNSPFNLNPGLVGVFDGNIRLHGNYRFQWNEPDTDFRSLDVGADVKFVKNCRLTLDERDKNYFSLGAIINNDRAGDLGLQNTGFNILGSYSLGVGNNMLLTPGISLGYHNRGFSYQNARHPNGANGGPNTEPNINNLDLNYFDVSGGVNLRYQKGYRKHLDLGVALYHWLEPSQKFGVGDYQADLARKLNLYGMLNWQLASRIDLILNGLFSAQNPYQEIVLNAQGRLYLDDAASKSVFLGAGVRLADAGDTNIDAWYPMIAVQLSNLYASFSYDLTISEFDWATRGGPELALRYIIAKPRKTPCRPCPIY